MRSRRWNRRKTNVKEVGIWGEKEMNDRVKRQQVRESHVGEEEV